MVMKEILAADKRRWTQIYLTANAREEARRWENLIGVNLRKSATEM